jgi:hypothetical protein
MKNICLLLIIAIGLFGCGQKNKQTENTTQVKDSANWICIPGIQVGEIKANTSEKDLIRIYGKKNVAQDSVSLGEGYYEKGTVVFKGTKNEVQITWKDSLNLANPEVIYIRQPNTEWKTKEGITIGTTLKELEKINGTAFFMLGFAWDYSGTIISWNHGKLEDKMVKPEDQKLTIRLDEEGEVKLTEAEYHYLSGDKEFYSSNTILQKLNPKVREILIGFN